MLFPHAKADIVITVLLAYPPAPTPSNIRVIFLNREDVGKTVGKFKWGRWGRICIQCRLFLSSLYFCICCSCSQCCQTAKNSATNYKRAVAVILLS